MAKPTATAPWATDANYPADSEPEAGTPTKAAYTLGQATVGWRPKGRPPARELNTWMNRVGQWTEFLDEFLHAGIVDFALGADVDDGDLSGTGDLLNVHTVNVTADADFSWVIGGIAFGVDGREIRLVNVGANSFFVHHEDGGSAAENRIFMPATMRAYDANILVPAGASITLRYIGGTVNRWYVVATVGCMKFQALRISAAAAAVAESGNDSLHQNGDIKLDSNPNPTALFTYPVDLPVGSIIWSWALFINKISDATTTIGAFLYKRPPNDVAAAITESGLFDETSANAPGYTSIGDSEFNSGAGEVVAAGYEYYVYGASNDAEADKDTLLHLLVEAWVAI